VVTFRPKDGNHTIINVTMTYDPQGMMESVADALGLLSRRVEGDLQRFKNFIQQRTTETGAWRGEIAGEQNLKDKNNEYDSSGKSGLEGSH